MLGKLTFVMLVAPHTGAWIETIEKIPIFVMLLSHPTRVRGLKLVAKDVAMPKAGRTPHGCVD